MTEAAGARPTGTDACLVAQLLAWWRKPPVGQTGTKG